MLQSPPEVSDAAARRRSMLVGEGEALHAVSVYIYLYIVREDAMADSEVLTVGDARAGLTGALRRFRDDPDNAAPVLLGSHRKPEAVILPYARYRRLTTQHEAGAEASVRESLHQRRVLIDSLARASRIDRVLVFGSVARGDDTPDSDIDLLVEPAADASLFDLARFEADVEALLGRPVDVVSKRALDPSRDRAVLAEAQPL